MIMTINFTGILEEYFGSSVRYKSYVPECIPALLWLQSGMAKYCRKDNFTLES